MKRIKIDLPEVNYALNFIESWPDQQASKRELLAIAANKHEPIKEQIRHILRKPRNKLETALYAAMHG